MRPVALFDLGNTLAVIEHRAFIESVMPSILPAYDQGDPQANIEYEWILAQGLRAGKVKLRAIDGAREKVEQMNADGMYTAVFSTCLGTGIDAALEQLGLEMPAGTYSTFDFQQENHRVKMPEGFRRVEEQIWARQSVFRPSGDIVLFADNKKSELKNARLGLDGRTDLYLIGAQTAPAGIIAVPTIAQIDHTRYTKK